MIIMGDYIESSLGVMMCLSTMAAAALGNTISDVLGLGLAHYVEGFFGFLGVKEPKLTPTQLKMAVTQRYASFVSSMTFNGAKNNFINCLTILIDCRDEH